MLTEVIVPAVAAVIGTAGGWIGGRKNVAIAQTTIQLLEAQVNAMQMSLNTLPELKARVKVLEDLVTQRANVEEVKNIVTRIEEKLNGTP